MNAHRMRMDVSRNFILPLPFCDGAWGGGSALRDCGHGHPSPHPLRQGEGEVLS
jgi:hypothetical protein